jgi:hypothetical protein
MYKIYQNSTKEGYEFDSFQDKMIQICNQHRDEKRALAFAFILYDFENPQMWKILEDTQYWFALNKITGEYLTVFSLHLEKERQKSKRNYSSGQLSVYKLFPVSTTNNPSIGSDELIKKYFGDDIKINYPAILFFQVDNNTIIDSLLVDLKEEMIEPAYHELKEYLKSSVDALKKIKPENRDNIKEIFDCLDRNVESTKTIRKVKRVIKNAGNLVGLISSIKGLF